jgi:dTDP-4-dehydrorhamnose reductase
MRIIIIGASGLIGRSLYNLAIREGQVVIGTYNSICENGLVQFNMLKESIRRLVPDLGRNDVVYLLSAYSNPSWIYENQTLARELNYNATKRLINDASAAGARVIFMSSVEVFDGDLGNYHELSIPNPLNLYGKMKYDIEQLLSEKCKKYCIVRTGWNVGWAKNHRCVIKMTYETLLKPNAKMAKNNCFSIIDVKDTARGLLLIGKNTTITTCHLASTPPILRADLANIIISTSKYKNFMSYEIVSFSEIPYSEARGRCNHLDNSLATSTLGMSFKSSAQIIQEKIAFLDQEDRIL